MSCMPGLCACQLKPQPHWGDPNNPHQACPNPSSCMCSCVQQTSTIGVTSPWGSCAYLCVLQYSSSQPALHPTMQSTHMLKGVAALSSLARRSPALMHTSGSRVAIQHGSMHSFPTRLSPSLGSCTFQGV